jgi:transketolase
MNKLNDKSTELSLRLRKLILKGALKSPARGAHLGGSLSCIDLLACLSNFWSFNSDIAKDFARLTLSKGHACLALYSFLLENNLIELDTFEGFQENGSKLLGHPVRDENSCIYFSSGSLGIGLSNCVGQAIYMKKKYKEQSPKIVCIVGDGEASEGIVYESLSVASNLNLNNLLIIFDINKFQQTGSTSEISNDLVWDKFVSSMGCEYYEILDGNNHSSINNVLNKVKNNTHSTAQVICAHTIKGAGIDFMENDNSWHYGSLTEEKYKEALNSLENR